MIRSDAVKNGNRKFVSQSIESDHAKSSDKGSSLFAKPLTSSLGLTVGLWALRRFPVATLIAGGLAGIYMWEKRRQGNNPAQGEGVIRDNDDYIH